ncbi:hypothetical protein DXG01_000900 [Tephrocybe rancida]|nr:hypothetical protein DXG01_000900 [Tephrocybe rancida]
MAPSRWTTEQQTTFLLALVANYLGYQKDNKISRFWVILYKKWFKEWSVSLSDDAQIPLEERERQKGIEMDAIKKKLREWFRNHARTLKKANKSDKALTLELTTKSSRRLQATEVYARKHYDTKIKPLLKEELEALDEAPRYRIGLVKKSIKKAWDAESDEVKRSILDEVEAAKEVPEAQLTPPNTVRTPQQYQSAIDCIPDAMEKLHDSLTEQTGWVWTILGGGPDPSFPGGEPRSVAFNFGKNFLKQLFKAWHDDWEEHISKPFASFVSSVFSPEVCASRALDNDNIPQASTSALTKAEYILSEGSDDEDNNIGIHFFPTTTPVVHGTPTAMPSPNPSVNTGTPSRAAPTFDESNIDPHLRSTTAVVPPASPIVPGASASSALPMPPVVPNAEMSPAQSDPGAPRLLLSTTSRPPSAVQPAAPAASTSTDDFIFPPALFSSPAPASLDTGDEGDEGEWSELLSGLKKRLAPPPAKEPKAKKQKKIKAPSNTTELQTTGDTTKSKKARALKLKNPPAAEETTGRVKHVRRAPGTKEVVPLTVSEDGKQVADAYGNPVGKENTRMTIVNVFGNALLMLRCKDYIIAAKTKNAGKETQKRRQLLKLQCKDE